MKFTKILILIFLICSFQNLFASTYDQGVQEFQKLISQNKEQLKNDNQAFFWGQGKKTKTVLLFHGLSNSPGDFKEIAKVYYRNNYNVVTVRLRDHGLLPEFRDPLRLTITTNQWREDIDTVLNIALKFSSNNKVALVGYSLGGVLATDTIYRHPFIATSIVYISPAFQISNAAAPMAEYVKGFVDFIDKGIPEGQYFYNDFAINQIQNTYDLGIEIHKQVIEEKNSGIFEIPKMMFLTDADTTISNDAAIKTALQINIPQENIILYKNTDPEHEVKHRDMPYKYIVSTGEENPIYKDMLRKIDLFLKSTRR